MHDLAVVHLVRRHNGSEPLRRFLDSYRTHPAGAQHELVLALKAYEGSVEENQVRALAADVEARVLIFPDRGLDIGTYFAAAAELEHDRLCFLNSFTTVQADDWLAKLVDALKSSQAGIVGAMGSYQSNSSFLFYGLGRDNAYASAFPERVNAVEWLCPFTATHRSPLIRRLPRPLAGSPRLLHFAIAYPPFPARHIRTNGFLAKRTMLRAIDPGPIRRKTDALRFESGWRSMTHRISRMGLDAFVVGADGNVWPSDEWHKSRTFWQSRQRNLLLADNQTAQYASGDETRRLFLSRLAWGPYAAPDA
jgi:hypothetical protein